jgi:hypothetical protein
MRPQIAWTPKVQAVMDKALQRDAALRYTSAIEFGRDLAAAVQGLSTATQSGNTKVMAEPDAWVPPTRVSETATPPAGGRTIGRMAAVGVGVAVVAIAGLIFFSTRGGADADATTTGGAPAGTAPIATPTTTGPAVGSPVSATPSQKGTVVPDPAPAETDPLAIVPGARMPRTSPVRPAGDVTVPSGGKSYADELRALEESIADSASAMAALRSVPILKNRVTLASDSAAVQFVEAKATMLTAGAAKGCALMRRIRRENLGAGWREQFTDGIQTCEGN